MNESFSKILGLLQRSRSWLCSVGVLLLTSCAAPLGNEGLSGVAAPSVQGIYQGAYSYGGAYQKLAGQSVTFEISLRQARGSGKVSGVIKETYTGTGVLKDGFVWSDISGTCEGENGYTHLKFRKTFRHSKEPAVIYHGSLPPGSTLLSGTWYVEEKTSDSGLFQISGLQVQ